jgi:glucose/arabinose dehydrogenase
MKKTVITLVFVLLLTVSFFLVRNLAVVEFFSPRSSEISEVDVEGDDKNYNEVVVIADDLSVPWDVAELSDGNLLVPERAGNLLMIDKDGNQQVISTFEEVRQGGEGGLLGVALHPDFEKNRWVYLYKTFEENREVSNRIVRYVLENKKLTESFVLLRDIPGARYHDGGMMRFGPDGKLYVTTGDATEPESAQDLDSLAGKILRLNSDGSIPDDNPFKNSLVYSYGHRNPQGLAWDNEGGLWSTEHGRSGIRSGFDELNKILAGHNYGWPEAEGDVAIIGADGPVLHSGADDTWAPASLAYADGMFLWGGLRGEALYVADQQGSNGVENFRMFFREKYGRIRAAVISRDGRYLFITTSNTDGRGTVQENDDKLIRIPLTLLR